MSWRAELRALRARDVVDSLRWLLLHNAGVKLLSVVIAAGLWFFVNAGERDAEMAVAVPVELRNIPAGIMLVSPRVDFIDLVVSGPRTLLNRIDREQLSLTLDLHGVRPGPAVFRIVGEALDLPRGVTVLRLTPSEVTLAFAATLRKQVPVRVAVIGKPPNELRIVETRAAPESVEVVGPAADVQAMKVAETTPIDVAEAGPGVLEGDVALEAPREYVSFSTALVHVQVRIEEPERTRTLSGVPVVVRDGAGTTRVTPPKVQLTVRGPRSVVDALELPAGAVYIDAAGVEPGTSRRTPAVVLPAGLELIKQEPSAVQLRIMAQKRRADGE